ncbi:MAG: hypothetical protein F6J87_15965 [Spirulina sp. SIO3F2]|nr:hypothetical protein [Spirulina sp. SIO3F2]
MVTRILFDQSGLGLPPVCPNCNAPTSSQIRIHGQYQQSKRIRTSSFSVPMCNSCKSQRKKAGIVAFIGHWLGAFGGVILGFWLLSPLGNFVLPSWFLLTALGLVVVPTTRLGWVYGKVLMLLLFHKLLPRGIGAMHAVSLDVVSFSATWLVVRNDLWAERVRGGGNRYIDQKPGFWSQVILVLFSYPYFFIFRQYERSQKEGQSMQGLN